MTCEYCDGTGMRHVENERQDQPAEVYDTPCYCQTDPNEFEGDMEDYE